MIYMIYIMYIYIYNIDIYYMFIYIYRKFELYTMLSRYINYVKYYTCYLEKLSYIL